MENSISVSTAVKQVETQVNMILRKIDQPKLDKSEREALGNLRQSLADARVYARDYELSEMRDEQAANAKTAKKYLNQSRQAILKASQADIFSAIDVAHLTAQIDQIIGDLK